MHVPSLDEPAQIARAAHLRYVTDQKPGITRARSGKGFRYAHADGTRPSADDMERIRKLVIPPAWQKVWICPRPNGHIQATGRDQKGRKQYLYHARWREVRDAAKYERLVAFAAALPDLRRAVERDLHERGLSRRKVVATVVRLLELTLIRVGNEEYARANGSYGLTTMREKHVKVKGATVVFRFRGKSGVEHSVDVQDARVARIVKQCQELPGHELFQYVDENGEAQTVDSQDVNDYLHACMGAEFTAKDFRTWAGSVLAADTLGRAEASESAAHAKRVVAATIKDVSSRLGNTPSVCRKCYVHPVVLESYMAGTLTASLSHMRRTGRVGRYALTHEERSLVALIEKAAHALAA